MLSTFTYLMSANSKSDSTNFATVVNSSPTTPAYLKPGVTYTGGEIDSACISVVAGNNTVVNASGMTKSNNGATILRGGTYSNINFPRLTGAGAERTFYQSLRDICIPAAYFGAIYLSGNTVFDSIVINAENCVFGGNIAGNFYFSSGAAGGFVVNDMELSYTGCTASKAAYFAMYCSGDKTALPATASVTNRVHLSLHDCVMSSGDVYGGNFCQHYGYARVDTLDISITDCVMGNFFPGGFVQTHARSEVGTVNMHVSGCSLNQLYLGGGASLADADNFSTAGTSSVEVSGCTIAKIFLSGLNKYSPITERATLTITSNGSFPLVTGKDANGVVSSACYREVIIAESCTIGTINTVDVITVHANKTLTITTSAELNKINLVTDLVMLPWVILSGADLSGIASVVFAVNGQEVAVTWNADNTVGVLGDTGYTLNVSGNVLTLNQA